jgi:hypothetical protein
MTPGIFPWIALAAARTVPQGWGLGVPVVHEAYMGPYPHRVCPLGHCSVWCSCLGWHPAVNSELI